MSRDTSDWLFKNAAECLLSAMLAEPGSSVEQRYMSGLRIFVHAAAMADGAA